MKTCIISDSHDRADALAAAIAKAQAAGAQAVIHCGDLIGANTLRAPIKLGVQIHAHGAEMIVTPRQLFQANVEVYQSEINKKKGNKLAMQVLYYSQLMKVAYGGSFKGAGLDGHVIQPAKLQRIAKKIIATAPAPSGARGVAPS